MNRKKVIIAAVLAIVLIASSAYTYIYLQGQAEESEKIEILQNLKDDHGYVTSLTDYPDRIISLAPSNTEILFELGLGDKVVAVTDYCDYPYNFSEWITTGNMTSIGAFENPNMEVIATLDPDLIFATGGVQEEAVASLRELGNKVLVLDPATVDDVLQDIILVGKATDRNQEAQSIVDDLRSRIDAVVNKVAAVASKPKVYYEIWYDPTSLWVAGSEAWQNELIEKAGGINIFADQQLDYFQSSAEAVIERNPDLILLPGGHGFGPPFWESFDAVKARPGWDSITAVQNNELYKIDQNLIARAGTRVADAIEILAEFFHPQLF